MATPEQKLIHNAIPTSLFLSDVSVVEDTAGTIDTILTKSTKAIINPRRACAVRVTVLGLCA